MVPPLRVTYNQKKVRELVHQIEDSKWPPAIVPSPVRLSFLYLGWSFMAALIISGIVLLYLRGFTVYEITKGRILSDNLGLLGIGKVLLVGLIIIIELFSKGRSIMQARFVFLISLIIVAISVLLVR
jgi:hypothetical protein